MGADSEALLVSGGPSSSVNEAQRKLLIGTTLCFLFMIAEIVGGLMAHSLAVMTDAAHMLSDVAGCAHSLTSAPGAPLRERGRVCRPPRFALAHAGSSSA